MPCRHRMPHSVEFHLSTGTEKLLPLYNMKHPKVLARRRKSQYSKGQGGQWLSGRMLCLNPRGHGFEPHRRHCLVSLSKTH